MLWCDTYWIVNVTLIWVLGLSPSKILSLSLSLEWVSRVLTYAVL